MREIKYLVTGPFGEEPTGHIIPAFLLFTFDEQPDIGLVFHPKRNKYECGSIALCRRVTCWPTDSGKDTEVWIGVMDGLYKNISSQKEIDRIFGCIKYDLCKTEKTAKS